jgi:hypothetical protein
MHRARRHSSKGALGNARASEIRGVLWACREPSFGFAPVVSSSNESNFVDVPMDETPQAGQLSIVSGRLHSQQHDCPEYPDHGDERLHHHQRVSRQWTRMADRYAALQH